VANTPEQFAAQQKADFDKRAQVIKAIGIQPERVLQAAHQNAGPVAGPPVGQFTGPLAVDLRDAQQRGQSIALFIDRADVVIQNLCPGQADAWG